MKVTYTGSFYRWRILGVPVAPGKVHCKVHPASSRVFRYIILTYSNWAYWIVSELLQTLTEWASKHSCTNRQWHCHLHHAASVVKPSWLHDFVPPHRPLLFSLQASWPILLSKSTRSDIQWWNVFLFFWNRISYMPPAAPEVHLLLDTSGSWGCAAIWNSHWFQIQWLRISGLRQIRNAAYRSGLGQPMHGLSQSVLYRCD